MSFKEISFEVLTYEEKYAHEIKKRERLYPLFQRVFGIESSILSDFSNRGLWNDDYFPYTFFHKDQAIANVSAFPLPMKINGTNIKCLGIQSVMTDPDYRKNGLMKTLFKKMVDDLERTYHGAFLFTSSPELYTPFGFKVIKQHYFKIDFNKQSIKQEANLKKLEPLTELEHMKILTEVFNRRVPLSKQFAPLSYIHCFYFNLYNPSIYEKVYFIEELETIIVFEVEDGTLRIFDIIGERIPTIEELCSYIPDVIGTVEFYFNPDVFNIEGIKAIEYVTENKLMARGSFQLDNQHLIMPLTAEF